MIDPQKPVRVFKNWKRGCYNIMQEGCIKASASQVRLVDVEFRVRESGRQRMLARDKRNVHAFAEGQLCDYVHPEDGRRLDPLSGRGVHYNPRMHTSFVDRESESPVTHASLAQFDESGVIYLAEAA